MWPIKADREGNDEELAIAEGVFVIGWIELDEIPRGMTGEALNERLSEIWDEHRTQILASQARQVIADQNETLSQCDDPDEHYNRTISLPVLREYGVRQPGGEPATASRPSTPPSAANPTPDPNTATDTSRRPSILGAEVPVDGAGHGTRLRDDQTPCEQPLRRTLLAAESERARRNHTRNTERSFSPHQSGAAKK